jgi:hypothetical protein
MDSGRIFQLTLDPMAIHVKDVEAEIQLIEFIISHASAKIWFKRASDIIEDRLYMRSDGSPTESIPILLDNLGPS